MAKGTAATPDPHDDDPIESGLRDFVHHLNPAHANRGNVEAARSRVRDELVRAFRKEREDSPEAASEVDALLSSRTKSLMSSLIFTIVEELLNDKDTPAFIKSALRGFRAPTTGGKTEDEEHALLEVSVDDFIARIEKAGKEYRQKVFESLRSDQHSRDVLGIDPSANYDDARPFKNRAYGELFKKLCAERDYSTIPHDLHEMVAIADEVRRDDRGIKERTTDNLAKLDDLKGRVADKLAPEQRAWVEAQKDRVPGVIRTITGKLAHGAAVAVVGGVEVGKKVLPKTLSVGGTVGKQSLNLASKAPMVATQVAAVVGALTGILGLPAATALLLQRQLVGFSLNDVRTAYTEGRWGELGKSFWENNLLRKLFFTRTSQMDKKKLNWFMKAVTNTGMNFLHTAGRTIVDASIVAPALLGNDPLKPSTDLKKAETAIQAAFAKIK